MAGIESSEQVNNQHQQLGLPSESFCISRFLRALLSSVDDILLPLLRKSLHEGVGIEAEGVGLLLWFGLRRRSEWHIWRSASLTFQLSR